MSGVLTPPNTVVQGQWLQGMVAPANAFTDQNGALTPAAFRFLFTVFNAVNTLQTQVTELNTRLTNAGIP